MNVFSSFLHATQHVFSGDSANADSSHALKQRWAQTSADKACRLIDDPGVFQLLRAMRDDSGISERNATDLARYLMGSDSVLPHSLFRLPKDGIHLADESKTLLYSLLRFDGIGASGNNLQKLETLLGLMERLEATRARSRGREASAKHGIVSEHAGSGTQPVADLSQRAGVSVRGDGYTEHSASLDDSVPDIQFKSASMKKPESPPLITSSPVGKESLASTRWVSGASDESVGKASHKSLGKASQNVASEVQTPVVEKILTYVKAVSPFDALASGQLDSIAQALENPNLAPDQVFELLTPKDGHTRPALRNLIGARTGNAEALLQKRSAFKTYLALLKAHGPRLTASQLKGLYEYLHASQTVKGIFWNSNSPGYDQLMEDGSLYGEFKEFKRLLNIPALPAAQRDALLVSPEEKAASVLRGLLEQPITAAFSIEHKRSLFREHMALLCDFAAGLDPAQRKRLYRHLHDSQRVPVGLLGKTNSDGYRQVMKDKALRQEYKMLKSHLAQGSLMSDTDAGRRFLQDVRRFHDGRAASIGAWVNEPPSSHKEALSGT